MLRTTSTSAVRIKSEIHVNDCICSESVGIPELWAPPQAKDDLNEFRSILQSYLKEIDEAPSLHTYNGQRNIVLPMEEITIHPSDALCFEPTNETVERDSLLTYLKSVQEYLQEEEDTEVRANCIREVFEEIVNSYSSGYLRNFIASKR